MDSGELAELQQLAVADFRQALEAGPSEASAVLGTYLNDLQNAPESVLLQLASAFQQHAGSTPLDGPAALPQLIELHAHVLEVVAPSQSAVQCLRSAWQDAAAAMLYGQDGDDATAALDRLIGCREQLASLFELADLQLLPPPASHQQCRSMLACLLLLRLHPDLAADLPAGTVQILQQLAAPAWLGRDSLHARQQQAAAFEAFAAVLQRTASRQDTSASQQRAALDFLLLFRTALPAVADLWWAHLAALLHAMAQLAGRCGTAVLRRPGLQGLIRSLCCLETAHMVVPLVLAHPAYQPDSQEAAAEGAATVRKGAAAGGQGPTKRGLDVAAALLSHDVPAFLTGCCELLSPQAQCTLQTRLQALEAMDRAAEAYLDSPDGQCEGAALRLWPPAALDRLLAALCSDPSIKVRRAAMGLLSCVAVAVGSPQEAALLHAVAQRCRDRDGDVRERAFAMLAQFPRASLGRLLSVQDWQAVLDAGLAGPPPGPGAKPGGSKAAAKRAGAVRAAAMDLLRRYLGIQPLAEQGPRAARGSGGGAVCSNEEDVGADDMGVDEPEGGDCGQAGAQASEHQEDEAWLGRLEQLGVPHLLSSTSPAASHLQAAWRQALREVLSEEQLAQSGILPESPCPGSSACE